MRKEEIKDKNYNVIGYIDHEYGRSVAYDKNYNVIGYFQDGKTYDRNWNVIVNGDVLSGLIYQNL